MAIDIFGFTINRKKEQEQPQVVPPSQDDGSALLSGNSAAYYSQVIDLDAVLKNESELVKRYREISLFPECDQAIDEVVNEAIAYDEEGKVCELNLEELKIGDGVKKKITEEFNIVLDLLDFKQKATDHFRSWYVDGRQYHLLTLDPKNAKEGIQRITKVDSRKIRKIKKLEKQKDPKTGVEVVTKIEEFFLYNEKGIESSATQGVKLSLDSVIYVPSGYVEENTNMMLSYLHKAVKPVNQLKMLEDAVVIYRIARAPERRIFYIDVGNLPKFKAEQYVTDIMNKYKNKVVYDAHTGEVRDDRKYMSMLEDFWMPRREGGKGTEITTLPGGQTLGQMDDVTYFQQKLYQSLNVPVSRLVQNQNFTIGRSNEITRDELRFNKFVKKLRAKFSELLISALRVQLIAKNIIRADDWEELSRKISVKFVDDNNFVEMRDSELWQNRFTQLQMIDPFVGRYVSKAWVKKNILRLSEDEIKEMDKELEVEVEEEPPVEEQEPAPQEEVPTQEVPAAQMKEERTIEDELLMQKQLAELKLIEDLSDYLKDK